MTTTIKVNRNRIENTYRRRTGGLITFFKLWVKSMRMVKGMPVKLHQKVWIVISFTFQSLVKPLGWFFMVKEVLRGEYELENGRLTRITMDRHWTLKFLFVPIWSYWRKARAEDLGRLKIIDEQTAQEGVCTPRYELYPSYPGSLPIRGRRPLRSLSGGLR